MANEYVNKVVVNGQTKVDLSGDTVAPENVLAGFTGHMASGAPFQGTYVSPVPESIIEQNDRDEMQIWCGTKAEYDALDAYDPDILYYVADGASPSGIVSSFNGRTGDVSPRSGDYTPGMVGAAAASHTHAISDITNLQTILNGKETAGVAATKLNRSTNVNAADTNYGTYMARGEALFASETNPTVNGTIAWTFA